jgi:shikimate kinase
MIVLVGLMGAGKTCIGIRLASRLGIGFIDADVEIEQAAGCPISDIFERFGESAFRDGEQRVIARLLDGPVQVLATGGGAYLNPKTRAKISEQAISIWLRADLDLLFSRVGRRDSRPMLKEGDPREILKRLMDERYPVYADADIVVESARESPDITVDRVQAALWDYLAGAESTEAVTP